MWFICINFDLNISNINWYLFLKFIASVNAKERVSALISILSKHVSTYLFLLFYMQTFVNSKLYLVFWSCRKKFNFLYLLQILILRILRMGIPTNVLSKFVCEKQEMLVLLLSSLLSPFSLALSLPPYYVCFYVRTSHVFLF